MELIKQAEDNITKINPKKLVLISTIDVFKTPVGVDENSEIDTEDLHAYGFNRYQLELWVREKYPDATDLTTAIQQEEDSFVCFLQDFFTLPENTYYVLEKDNMPVSAARLSKINDFYYLEALETPPQYRKKGYASELLNEMITHLHQQSSVDIRDCVSKTNTASLATHKKCGFFIAEENGIYYPSNTVNNKTYGMRYFIR